MGGMQEGSAARTLGCIKTGPRPQFSNLISCSIANMVQVTDAELIAHAQRIHGKVLVITGHSTTLSHVLYSLD